MPTFDAGTARYRIELDTSNMNNQFTQVVSGFNKADMSMNQMGKSAGALKNNFQSMNSVFAQSKTPLNAFTQQAGALPGQFDRVGQAAENTGKKLKGVGEFFRSNKGLVFGGAGLASAAAEAAGMMNMYGDAVAQNAEAQKNLAEVQADTSASTQDVARAEQEAAKASKWLGMTTRNLVLSQMDQVFFATMVISQLSQMNLKGGILGKTLGSLKTAFSGVAGAQGMSGMANALTAGSDAMGMFSTKATTTSKVMTMLKNNIGLMIGAFAGLAASIVIINQVEAAVSQLYGTIGAKPTQANLLTQVFDPERFKQGMAETRTVMELTGASLLEIQTNAVGVGQRFLELGGQVDKTGKIVIINEDHFFSLGTAMDLLGKKSAQYIRWSAVKLAQGQSEAQVLKFLEEATIDAEIALKILNIAKEDAKKIDLDGISSQEAYTAATRYRSGVEKEANNILDEYLVTSNQANVTTDEGMQLLEDYLHVKLDDITATEAEKARNEDLIQTVMKLADTRSKEEVVTEDLLKVRHYLSKSHEDVESAADEEAETVEKYNKSVAKEVEQLNALLKVRSYLAKSHEDMESQADEEADTAMKNMKIHNMNMQATIDQQNDYAKVQDYVARNTKGVASAADEAQESITRQDDSIDGAKKTMTDMFQNLERDIPQSVDKWALHEDAVKANEEAMKALQKTAYSVVQSISQAQSNIAESLDLKLKDKEKMTKKLFKMLPDNIAKDIKADIKFDLNLKTAKESIMDTLWGAVGADLKDSKMDKVVNKMIKFLEKSFGKDNPATQGIRDELASTIAGDDTQSKVAALMKKWEETPIPVQVSEDSLNKMSIAVQAGLNGTTYSVLVAGKYAGLVKGGNAFSNGSIINPNAGERKGFVPNSAFDLASKGKVGDLITETIQGSVPLQGVITKINIPSLGEGINKGLGPIIPLNPDILFGNGTNSSGNNGGKSGSGTDFTIQRMSDDTDKKLTGFQKFIKTVELVNKALGTIAVAAQHAQTGIANLAIQGVNSLAILAKGSSKQVTGFINNLNKGYVSSGHLQEGIANLANEGASSLALLAKVSSKQMNGMTNNLNKGYESAGHLQEGLANLANEGSNSLSQLAKSSSKNMNGLINNMEAGEKAVKSLKSAIDSLKDKTVTVKYRQEGAPQSKGGLYSFAQGGTVSAAGGLTTVSQPTHFIYGDNPGNHETLAFIPHNNPGPIMDKLEKMFGNNGKGGTELLQNIVLNIKGSDIINDMKFTRKVKMTVGENRDRFGI